MNYQIQIIEKQKTRKFADVPSGGIFSSQYYDNFHTLFQKVHGTGIGKDIQPNFNAVQINLGLAGKFESGEPCRIYKGVLHAEQI